MTDPTSDVEAHDPGPVPDETDDGEAGALAALEAGNYAEAVKGYQPPAEHATQPDQVDPLPQHLTTDLRHGEAK